MINDYVTADLVRCEIRNIIRLPGCRGTHTREHNVGLEPINGILIYINEEG